MAELLASTPTVKPRPPIIPVFTGVDGRMAMYRVTFVCGHRNALRDPAPVPDEFQWCPRCMDWQLVVKVDQQWDSTYYCAQ